MINERLKTLLVIVIIVFLGTLAINQTLGYYYKSKFLQGPCQTCIEINPHLSKCFEEESKVTIDKRTGDVVDEIPFNFSFIP